LADALARSRSGGSNICTFRSEKVGKDNELDTPQMKIDDSWWKVVYNLD
jgi:hypothetical protein